MMKRRAPHKTASSPVLEGGMPRMMGAVYPLEVLLTPGQVTLITEWMGQIRRVYTDGRKHPDDPDPTWHGHSIGHWEKDTLVVDTVGILPQSLLAVSEAAGVPTNGDVHVVERFRLTKPDTMIDEITVTAPHVLTAAWTTTREYFRQRARQYEIVESVCLQGHYTEDVDAHGDAVFLATPQTSGGTPQSRAN